MIKNGKMKNENSQHRKKINSLNKQKYHNDTGFKNAISQVERKNT